MGKVATAEHEILVYASALHSELLSLPRRQPQARPCAERCREIAEPLDSPLLMICVIMGPMSVLRIDPFGLAVHSSSSPSERSFGPGMAVIPQLGSSRVMCQQGDRGDEERVNQGDIRGSCSG